MEGTPFIVENNNDNEKERRHKEKAEKEDRNFRTNKPEALGILAIEPTPKEPELSPLEEEAHSIVREMVLAKQRAEAQQAEASESEINTLETEAAEIEPVEVPKTTAVETSEPANTAENAEDDADMEKELPLDPEAAEPPPITKPELEVKPETKTGAETKSAEKPETPPDDKDEKPGFISSLFRRRGRGKVEKPKETPTPEVFVSEAPIQAAEKEEERLEGPEFRFNETPEEAIEEPAAGSEKLKTETDTENQPALKPKPERIGQVLLGTEAAPAEEQRTKPVTEAVASSLAAEEKMKVEASPIEPVSGKRIDTLSRPELMEVAEKIVINDSNLRHIYETHLIGERGLRRLVAEHLRGGDLSKALRREVMEHERDFERDPVLRDLAPTLAASLDNNSNVALEKLLQQADVSMANNSEQTAVFQAQARHEVTNQQRQHQQRRLLDVSLMAVIAILIVSIIFIYMSRG
jgi:hypothetical protein